MQGERLPNGSVLAHRIRVHQTEPPGQPVEFHGAIVELIPSATDPRHEGTMVVAVAAATDVNDAARISVQVTTETEIYGEDQGSDLAPASEGTRLTFGDLQVGDRVEVQGERLPNGSVLAHRIRVKGEGQPGHDVEVHGVIAELIPSDTDPDHAGTMIVASGNSTHEVIVSATTEIYGEGHDRSTIAADSEETPLTFADLQVGDRVEVKGNLQSDRTILARRIKVEGGEHHNGHVKWHGLIESLPDTTGQIGTWVVAGIPVEVDANTRIEGTPEVGAWAEVKAQRQNDDSLLATKIEVRNEHPVPEVEFKGPIDSFGSETWVVRGISVTITADTRIEGTPAVGLMAEVHALVMPDRSLVATKIKVEDPEEHHDRFVEFKGRIEEIVSDTEWLVGAVTVMLDSQTVVEGTPAAGKIAEVKGLLQTDGSVLARKIEVKESDGHGPREVELRGTIVSMSAVGSEGEWTIHALHGTLDMNVTFTVDSQTIIDESHGIAQVGAYVKVEAILQTDGSLLAKRIKVKR